jgi:hypothetical protein
MRYRARQLTERVTVSPIDTESLAAVAGDKACFNGIVSKPMSDRPAR